MSDQIKHECGIAFVRLLKPLEYYQQKYGTAFYGLNKLHLMMQKQRNRGQDGAGIATIKLNAPPGTRYISRRRSNSAQSLKDVFEGVFSHFQNLEPHQLNDGQWLKNEMPYMGELMMGHLRYGTHGQNVLENVHPFLRQNNWMSRNIVMAGNFNLTNVDELFQELVELGQHPKEKSDTVTVMEKIGHFLDAEVQRWFNFFKVDGYDNEAINDMIHEHLDVLNVLRRASKKFDGGYAMVGLIGHGDGFIMRDPSGIRPAFYYHDDEIVVAASERPAIMTACNVLFDKVQEIPPGHALVVKKNGKVIIGQFTEQRESKPCSFERIYFSRGTDKDIYRERKKLGEQLAKPVLEMVNYDFKNTVFSFIPNTAETAFMGMIEGLEKILSERKQAAILALGDNITNETLGPIMQQHARIEKIAVKDEKLRTFITDDASRGEMVSHVYDVTYGIVRNDIDTLVLLDDSIVRGTTLRNSIISNVARLRPKKIIIVSSAPQIRYPDCYGIDMSKLGEFVAFKALIDLLKQDGKAYMIQEMYERCLAEQEDDSATPINVLQTLYKEYSYEEITTQIAKIVTPKNIAPSVELIYQTVEGLHEACPNHGGDWYFSGNYPTQGGTKVSNRAFINYVENKNVRAY